jgi:hypothetical protein
VTPAVVPRIAEVVIDHEARKGKQPSDHAPVIAELGDPPGGDEGRRSVAPRARARRSFDLLGVAGRRVAPA